MRLAGQKLADRQLGLRWVVNMVRLCGLLDVPVV